MEFLVALEDLVRKDLEESLGEQSARLSEGEMVDLVRFEMREKAKNLFKLLKAME